MVASSAAMCAHWQRCAFCDAEESCDHQLLAQERAVKRSPTVGASRRTSVAPAHENLRFSVFLSFFCAKRCASSFYISRFFIRKKIAPKWTHSYIVPSIFKIYCDECTILCFGAMQHCELGYSHTSGFDLGVAS